MEPRIVRSHRRSMSIHITDTGELLVQAPFLAPQFVIKKFIQEHEDWITKHLKKFQQKPTQKRTYQNGEQFLFLGKQLYLTYVSSLEIATEENKLLFPKVLLFRAKKELENWYIKQAKEIITRRVMYHAEKMHASYKSIMFSETKSKWGTCTAENDLQFNWKLVMVPLVVLDYVVIHELVHTTEKHHQQSFWKKVAQYTPAFKQHRKWLNENMHLMTV